MHSSPRRFSLGGVDTQRWSALIDLVNEFLTHERNRDLRTYALVSLILIPGITFSNSLGSRFIPTQTKLTAITPRPAP